MAYLGYVKRLQVIHDKAWSALEAAEITEPQKQIDASAMSDRSIHDLHLSRLFAAMGLRDSAVSADQILRAVKRSRVAINSSESVAKNFDRVVSFAERVVESELSHFKQAQDAYLNAQDR